jgi:hypothetical protein
VIQFPAFFATGRLQQEYRGRFLKLWSCGVALSSSAARPTLPSLFVKVEKNASIPKRPTLGRT